MAPRRTAFDVELEDLPDPLRRREWIARVEVALFAAPEPVSRDQLAGLVGAACNLDQLLAELGEELRPRPYELVQVAGGYALRTRERFKVVIQALFALPPPITKLEATVLMIIAYYQPITRGQIGFITGAALEGREIDPDLIGRLRKRGLIANGPRSAEPGAPIMLVTTPEFLDFAGLNSLEDLPEREVLERDGLLDKEALLRERRAFIALRGAEPISMGEEPPATDEQL